MAQDYADAESWTGPHWRRPAPRARAFAMALFSWQHPALVFALSLAAAAPFIVAAFASPALLSLAPTLSVIAPIADARAAAAGSAPIAAAPSPFTLALLMLGDLWFDSPGRIHLAAKGFGAALAAAPLAYFAAARLPVGQAALLTAAIAAFVAAPLSGPVETSLALFLVVALALLSAPADESRLRARLEGGLAGALLFALWTSHPIFALLGFLALSACPFLTGRRRLDRYVAALAAALLLAGLGEALAPGLNLARADAASGALAARAGFAGLIGVWGLAGVAASTAIVLFAAAVFGGRDHAAAWLTAAMFLALSLGAARLAGAQSMPLFAVAAAIAVFSVASPFYDGIFRCHDRASIAVAASAAALTLFWTAAVVVQSSAQFALQLRAAARADDRAAFGLAAPEGALVVGWIEEGRLATPAARERFAMAPLDEAAILVAAAARARRLAEQGLDVAILTGADTACVVPGGRRCDADGLAAARRAKIVFVPRIDFDAATAAAKGRSEALLYTEFRMVERSALWEIWVRRGVSLPAAFVISP
jgi:hypothetical protein